MTTSGLDASSKLIDSGSLSPEESVAQIRREAALEDNEGPTDKEILAAVDGFAGQFNFWYSRVIENSVRDYRKLIVARINPFIRRIEYEGMGCEAVADRLVNDYVNRNFVTAGGWAIEKMAIALGSQNAKSAARGIDLYRVDPLTNIHHLYVIKSGTVTRNSDILKALKQHARDARKLLRQGGAQVHVTANYAIAAGATSTTDHDDIRRPSSEQFWSEVTALVPDKAIRLALLVAKQAAFSIKRDTDRHVQAMKKLVQVYIQDPGNAAEVDWDYLFQRTMKDKDTWREADQTRHEAAVRSVAADGYELPNRRSSGEPKAAKKPRKRQPKKATRKH